MAEVQHSRFKRVCYSLRFIQEHKYNIYIDTFTTKKLCQSLDQPKTKRIFNVHVTDFSKTSY